MASSSEGAQDDLVKLTSLLHGWIALNTLKTKLSEGEKKDGEENPTETALEAAVQDKLDELNSFLEELITKGVLKPGTSTESNVPDLGSGEEEEEGGEEGGGEGEGEKEEAASSSASNSMPTGNKPVAPTDTTQTGGKKRNTRRRFLH